MEKTDYWGHDRPLSTGGSLATGGGGSQSGRERSDFAMSATVSGVAVWREMAKAPRSTIGMLSTPGISATD